MRLGLSLDGGGDVLDVAVQHGIKGVPVSADQLANGGVDATLAPLKERGLEVCQIGLFMFNVLNSDTEAQAKQAATLKEVIPLAADTGCPYIVINGGNFHPSGYGAGDTRNFAEEALDRVAEGLKPHLEAAEKYGAKLTIEAYLKTVVNSPESFLKLKEKVGGSDALCCNIDVTSLYDYRDLWNPAPKVEHICTSLAGHYGLGHIKGIALKDGFHIHAELTPITEDPTDWEQVLTLMAPHVPQDSWVILEHVASLEEAEMSIAHLHNAASNAGVILS